MHPLDRFHLPNDDDPYFIETSWHSFDIPERKLTGQLYGYFLHNLGVCAAAAYVWDDSGSTLSTCLYAKNFWHLPIPKGADRTDLELANGIRYKCLEPLTRYELGYRDPDHDEIEMDLVFEAFCPPQMLGDAHLDQPGRYRGTLRIGDEILEVDSFGMRDGTWHVRSPFGGGMQAESHGGHGGYTFGAASPRDAFHVISREVDGDHLVALAGYVMRDGEMAKLTGGSRDVLERKDGHPTRIRLELEDDRGRSLEVEGRGHNALGMHRSPNAWTWNCLTEWQWDGLTAWGEDHDNWSTAGVRKFLRGEA